jgi:ribosomal protein S18 acetylase RimI-like enzyme
MPSGGDRGGNGDVPFRIRHLGCGDFRAVSTYDWAPLVAERYTIYRFLTHDHSRYSLVAEDANGCALGYVVSVRSADGVRVFVFHVHVRPDSRRRGVGTALVRALEETAAADGVELIWFLASEKNRRFYSRLGYAVSDELLDAEARRYAATIKRTSVMSKRIGDPHPSGASGLAGSPSTKDGKAGQG